MENCWNISELGYIYQAENDLIEEEQYSILYELENLYIDGKVDKINSDYIIRHNVAATFKNEERDVLHLPAVFPYIISIKHKGNLANNRFHYILSFFDSNRKPFVNPEIIGTYIRISPEVDYLFNYHQYDIVRTVQQCNNAVKGLNRIDALMFNCEHLAQIKQSADKVDAKLSDYLKSKNIVVPEKITIDIEKNKNDEYFIKPILLEGKEKNFEPLKNIDSFEAAFERQERANSTYIGTDQTIYIMKPNIKSGLQEIKDNKKIKKEDIERIEKQPKEIFSSDAFEFDLSNYSDRVISIGDFVRKSLPYLNATEGSWLPEEGAALFSARETSSVESLLPLMNRDNIIEIIEKIKVAQEAEQQNFIYNDTTYPITKNLTQRAFEVYEQFFGKNHADNNENDIGSIKTSTFQALNIKDNIDKLEYEARKEIYGILNEKMFSGLNENIHLYSHQKSGVQWMFQCWKDGHHGVLLADDMGLGKTMQAYTFISGLKLSSPNQEMRSVLVVAPVSLLKNWEDEFKKFIRPNLFEEIIELYGGAIKQYKFDGKINLQSLSKNYLVLTTYETLRDYQLSFGCIEWSVMVIDEAHKIKNPTTMITTAVKAMQYDFGIALTGTPVENTWNDLWSIMDFVAPGKLGSLKNFHQKYQGKIKNIKHNREELNVLGEKLQQEIQPVFLRRLKKDILNDLPEKKIIKLEEPMPPEQQKAYEMVIRNARDYKGKIAKGQILKVIAELRDVSLCPYLGIYKDTAFMNQDYDSIIHSSARLKKTFDVLDDIKKRNEKVLIFITSRKMQRIVKYIIEKKYGISVPPAINGAMQSERRQEVVSNFNEAKGFKVLLLSVEAGGVGFNITAANNVIHLSRCWNPAKEDQATDRVYRIGQQKNVNVYLPIAYDSNFLKEASFDEKLDHLLDYKRNLSESVLYPTGDSSEEGFAIFNEILGQESTDILNEENERYGNVYWTIDDMANVEGIIFEKLIGKLFTAMSIYDVEVTPPSNDKGADIVVKKKDGKTGFLVQCKQTSNNKNMNQGGVVEVYGALSYYNNIYNRQFEGCVVTNAKGYTENAYELAQANHVKLIARDELADLLKKFPISKF